ncbi:hypothetical protein Sjap_018064 [Stephania japonica]|uniref:Uncharacterized protein n=1 Tax=Stephania japonica TaxID=461633 RepID=A0AAP0NKP7_9MAGN
MSSLSLVSGFLEQFRKTFRKFWNGKTKGCSSINGVPIRPGHQAAAGNAGASSRRSLRIREAVHVGPQTREESV